MHGEFFVKTFDRKFLAAQDAKHVLQRTGDEEKLLREAQLLAVQRFVVGI